ncbi:hypothetical protein B0H13DRAFT_1877257 [Mycena leptocephala]|nr:hypothetical protein B0H13DRAFT_1877257 [Mycena leptocephala]
MTKLLGIAMLSVGAVAAFDTSNFFTSQGNLKNAAIVFGGIATTPSRRMPRSWGDYFYGGRAFTAAAAISPLQFPSGPLFSDADAQLLNSTFVPVTQQIILSKLNSLQAGQAFFESVNNAPLFRTSFCHWVGTLAQENIAFLDSLVVSSPDVWLPPRIPPAANLVPICRYSPQDTHQDVKIRFTRCVLATGVSGAIAVLQFRDSGWEIDDTTVELAIQRLAIGGYGVSFRRIAESMIYIHWPINKSIRWHFERRGAAYSWCSECLADADGDNISNESAVGVQGRHLCTGTYLASWKGRCPDLRVEHLPSSKERGACLKLWLTEGFSRLAHYGVLAIFGLAAANINTSPTPAPLPALHSQDARLHSSMLQHPATQDIGP